MKKKKEEGIEWREREEERERKIGTGEGDVYVVFLACTDSVKRFRDRNYGNERP